MCNPGLACNVVNGAALCVPAGDAGAGDASSSSDSGSDSGLPVCKFAPTPWPTSCTGASCFGATQSCSLTGCNTDERWECFSPNQCSSAPCCLSASVASLTPAHNCTQGALTMASGTASASVCAAGASCGSDDAGPQIQLCQFNDQCPVGQICSAVRVVASDAVTINGAILGACMPP
jgi:hypothetical protein